MTDRHSFVVMLQIQTNDPRLTEKAIAKALGAGQPGGFARMRHAILQHLPKDVTRVIALFPVAHAKLLMMLHEANGEAIAKILQEKGLISEDDGTIVVRPPAGYVPPTRN
jgi:hypothetical protein